MSFIDSIISRNKRQPQPFTIYENAYLTSEQDEIAQQQYKAITFTGMLDFAYKNQVNIAYEPLENSNFSSDSLQTTPDDLFVTGVVAQEIKNSSYTADDILQDQAQVEAQLNTYLKNTTLLCITVHPPIFKIYPNLHLISIAFDLTPDKTNLVAYMTFRTIRMTSTQYGGLQQNQVKNPNNTSQVNNGTVSPQTTGTIPMSGI
jgi:hypothetical protein